MKFSLTLKGCIRKWYEVILDKSIHIWERCMEVFLTTHYTYDCKPLYKEFEYSQRQRYETIQYFHSRILKIYYRFYDDD